jgi:DNA-binding transcriptional ArsR family regulator
MSKRAEALADRSAPIFAALGDPTRLAIVSRLANEGPLSISRLTAGTPVTRQAITKHLQVLATAGLVLDERRGRERVFALEPTPLADAQRQLNQISARWDRAIHRLRALVER